MLALHKHHFIENASCPLTNQAPSSVFYYPGLALELEATFKCMLLPRHYLITLLYRCLDSSAPSCSKHASAGSVELSQG
jgi:hypothetical protein